MSGRMIPPLSRTDRRQPWLALLLVFSLLFTQWLGFGHAVAHGNGLPELVQATTKVANIGSLPEHQKSSSTCVALDAATLGAGVPMADYVPASTPLTNAPVTLPLRTGWHRLFTAHFNSRAPPLNA